MYFFYTERRFHFRADCVLTILICFFFSGYIHAQCATPINTFPYVADFEASQDNWTSGGTNSDWAWGTPSKPSINSAGSGAKCWVSGGLTASFYNYSEASWVQSPCFDFTNLQHPFIAFLYFRESEYKFDGANLQYSLNQGTSWTNVGSLNDATDCMNANWYNYNPVKYLLPISPVNDGWCGNSKANSTESGTTCQGGHGSMGWIHAKHCMQNLAGKPSVIFRFTFGAGTTCNHFDGFAFDSVSISEAVANTGTLNYICNTATTVTFTGTATLPCTESYAYNFGDPGSGASNTATTATATHTFSASGTYTVKLIISGGPCNAPDTLTQVIHILGISSTTQKVSCFGGNDGAVNITVAGGTGTYNYNWTGGASSQNLSGLTAGTYTVTVTAPLTCQATASATVNQPAQLTSTLTTSGGGCSGNSGAINDVVGGGTAPYTYNWGGGITTANRTGLGGGNYTVTVTDSKGCTATASATITVNATPTVTVNNASVCAGGTATLTATPTPAGGTYLWSTGATASSISVTPGANTGYTVTYTAPQCGSVSSSATVTVANNASVNVSNDTICQGAQAVLYATPSVGGGTYSWAPGGGTDDSIVVSPGANTSYTVTYTPVGCPAATGSGTVTVAPLPTVTLTETEPGCTHGGIILASGSGGQSPYQYALAGAAYQSADSFNNLAPGNYSITAKDTLGCISPAQSATVGPYTPLSVNSTIDSITCTVTTGQISAVAAGGTSPYQYAINGGTYQNSGTFSGLSAASYILTAQDAAGCTITENVIIPTASTIVAQATADSAICYGSPTGKISASATGGSSPYQYNINGTYQNSSVFYNLLAGSYTVTVKDANGCLASQVVQVYQPDSLFFVSVTATGIKCPGQKNGTITVVGGGGTQPYRYVATKDSTNFFTTTNDVVVGLDSGSYFVELTDNHGCSAGAGAYVPGVQADSFQVKADSTTCLANDGAVIVTPIFNQNAPFSYSLNHGAYQSSDSFAGLVPGNYVVVAMDVNGCSATLAPVTVIEPSPSFAAAYPTDTTIHLGQTVQLSSYLYGSAGAVVNSYAWSPQDGLSCPYCPNPLATPYMDVTTYTVTITYNGDCTAKASVTINGGTGEVYVPNAFTPNGDGNNDVFQLYGYGIKVVILKVFNRWGEKVFESHDQYNGWDGTYKGYLQMPGVYVYEATVVFLDNRTTSLKGSITLVR